MLRTAIRSALYSLLFALAGGQAGCGAAGGADVEQEAGLDVVVSIEPQRWLVERVGGDRVRATVMVPPGQSPHGYEPVPAQLFEVGRADLYLAVGTGVEFEVAHLDALRESAPSMKVVEIAADVRLRDWSVQNHDGHGHGDGHHHGVADPHVWLAPANLREMAGNVHDALAEADPAGAAGYRERAIALDAELDRLDRDLRTLLKPRIGSGFLVVHPSWGYFADAYGLRQLAVEEDGQQPGPAGLAEVITQANRESIDTVFVSPQFDASAAQVIAAEIGGQVVTVDPLAADVPAQLRALAEALSSGSGTGQAPGGG